MIYREVYVIQIVRNSATITVEQADGRENLTTLLSQQNATLQEVRFEPMPILTMEDEYRIKGDQNAY